MFDLIRFITELIFGSSLSLSRESLEYLSSNLHNLIIQLLQQSFSITLRSKRTRLLGDDLQLILKCRGISPLYGYCCSSTTNKKSLFQIVSHHSHTSFIQTDVLIDLNIPKRNIVLCNDIILYVEWLSISDEQKSSLCEKSILKTEQQFYLSYFQSKYLNEEILNLLCDDKIALNTILSNLIQFCKDNICQCLLHSCQLQKRQQIISYLTIIDCLLKNSSINIDTYSYILSPIIINCLLYEFDIDERLDVDNIYSIRRLAAQSCIKILQRSNNLIYDVFYIRIMSQLIYSLTNSNTSSSIIYAILYLFQQLDVQVCRTFLLPHLLDIDSAKIIASEPVIKALECIAVKILEQ